MVSLSSRRLKPAFPLILMFLMGGTLSAQESKFSFGLGGFLGGGTYVENNRIYDGGGGWTGAAEYRFNEFFSGGLKNDISNDFKYHITLFTQSVFARWYPLRKNFLEVFVEAGPEGIFILRESEPRASLGIFFQGGVRFLWRNWYVEPYLGTGYPMVIKGGLMIGYRVPVPKPPAPQNTAPETQKAADEALDAANRLDKALEQYPADTETQRSDMTQHYLIIFPGNKIDFTGLDTETDEENRRILQDIENLLKANPAYRVLLEGHANPTVGTEMEERNELEPLSRRRAELVADLLVNAGVNRNQLVIAGSGGLHPASDSDKNKNRRVELTILK